MIGVPDHGIEEPKIKQAHLHMHGHWKDQRIHDKNNDDEVNESMIPTAYMW